MELGHGVDGSLEALLKLQGFAVPLQQLCQIISLTKHFHGQETHFLCGIS